jgi:alanyl-tRNA synthetase
LQAIEKLVNKQIVANTPVETKETDIESAKAMGAMALFGEKYGDTVRVLSMGTDHFSVELCGGTHVRQTGDIALFSIASESGVAAGIRRIEALTARQAYDSLDQQLEQLKEKYTALREEKKNLFEELFALDGGATAILEPNILDTKLFEPVFDVSGQKALETISEFGQLLDHLRQACDQLQNKKKALEKQIQKLKAARTILSVDDLLQQATEINGVNVLIAQVNGVDGGALREISDRFKNHLGTAVVLLATVQDDKVSLVAAVTQNAVDRVKAGDLMKQVAPLVGGKGGGRPDMAQGGGTDVEGVDKALAHARAWLEQTL